MIDIIKLLIALFFFIISISIMVRTISGRLKSLKDGSVFEKIFEIIFELLQVVPSITSVAYALFLIGLIVLVL